MNSGALRGTGLQWLDGKNTGWDTGPTSARPLNRQEHLKHRDRLVSLFSQCLVLCLVWRTHHHHHHQNKHCAKCFTCKSLRHYWCVFYKKGK